MPWAGHFDKALAAFSAVAEFDPVAEAFLNRANVYRAKDDLERARQDLETALKLDPQLASAKDALTEGHELIANALHLPAKTKDEKNRIKALIEEWLRGHLVEVEGKDEKGKPLSNPCTTPRVR